MSNVYLNFSAFLWLLLLLSPANAKEFNQALVSSTHVSSDDALTESKQSLISLIELQKYTTTGEATFSILFWDLYKSKLLTTSGKYPISNQDDSLIFSINYLADISNEDLIMRTVEQWDHLGINPLVYEPYLEQLKTLWPNIVSGDNLALLLQNDKSIFYFNDQYLGEISDPKFGQIFIDIWLSEGTSQPALRAELIGEATDG